MASRRPDNTPEDNDRVEIGQTALAFNEWFTAGIECLDLPAMREYRWKKLTDAIVQRGLAGLLMYDPFNVRYPQIQPICSIGVHTTLVGRTCC